MTNSLKEKALSGIVWKFFETALSSVIGFVISVVLARLLSPSDYGLIGMMAIFIALSQLFFSLIFLWLSFVIFVCF